MRPAWIEQFPGVRPSMGRTRDGSMPDPEAPFREPATTPDTTDFAPTRLAPTRLAPTRLAPTPARPRILFVDHTASLGGGEIALLNLVRHLDRRRFYPIVVLFSDGPLAGQFRAADVETHVLPLDRSVLDARKDRIGVAALMRVGIIVRSLRHALRLRRFIRRQRVDLVHANSLKADLIAGLAARGARVPVIWHIRDRITADYLPRAVVKAFRFLARVIPSFVVANSDATLKTLELKNHDCAATVYSGIDLAAIPPGAHSSSGECRGGASATSSTHAPLIGLVGRITRWKGQDVFLGAAAEVLKVFPAARFQVIGAALFSEQDYEREIRELARSLHIERSVDFTGFRDDVPALIARLDLLVHASTTGEPFGQVIVEGMAAGKPVVATRGGGVPEIVIDGETGLLVPMADPAAMAAAINRILRDPARARQMGDAGRSRALAMFTAAHTADQIQGIYEALIRTNHRSHHGVPQGGRPDLTRPLNGP